MVGRYRDDFCQAGFRFGSKGVSALLDAARPLYLQKQTSPGHLGMSAKCQKQTTDQPGDARHVSRGMTYRR